MKHRLLYLYRLIVWNMVSRVFVRVYLGPRYHFKLTKNSARLPRPPFVIISNHGTFFDPWIVGGFSPFPFAIMCNDEAFSRGSFSRWYLNSTGAYPKKKGVSDFKAMKQTMSRLSHGYPVCIFPEGQTSWDGETQLMYRGIEKIVRKSGVPLVIAKVSGNFLTKPWWADTLRRGNIFVTFDVVTPDRIRPLSDDQLFFLMKSSLNHNDVKDPDSRRTKFSGSDLARGLERFVWLCPGCGREDRFDTEGNTIRCACGASWSIDAGCKLTPATPSAPNIGDLNDWAHWHRGTVLDIIRHAAPDAVLTTSDAVRLQIGTGHFLFADSGIGSLSLTPSTLTFTCTDAGTAPRTFPVQDIQSVVIQHRDIVEYGFGGTRFRLVFDGHSPMKWIYYLRYLKGYEKFEEQGYIG